jgi:hypothetical protein
LWVSGLCDKNTCRNVALSYRAAHDNWLLSWDGWESEGWQTKDTVMIKFGDEAEWMDITLTKNNLPGPGQFHGWRKT